MSNPTHPRFTPIKICGLTREADVQQAVQLGVNAIGFVMYAQSPRAINPERARALCQLLPPFVTPVLLFVNAHPTHVWEALRQVPNALLQFHGDESPADCEQFGRPYLKAARIPVESNLASQFDLARFADHYQSACGLLLDTLSPQFGGTGTCFDWSKVDPLPKTHLVLSGGLHPHNVAEAIAMVQPKGLSLAVDVSSGVEAAKGIKDVDKMRAFVRAVRSA